MIDDRLRQLFRDALEPMLDERFAELEDRMVDRVACALVEAPAPAPLPLITADELAAYLKIDKRTIRRMVEAGDLPAPVHVTVKRPRWRWVDIDAWLEERKP